MVPISSRYAAVGRLVLILTALALAVSLTAPSPSAGQEAAGNPQAAHVGLVRPSQRVVVHAPLDGRLAELLVDEGQRVEAGQTLGRMEDDVQRAAVEAARLRAVSAAPLRLAELGVEEARVQLDGLERALKANAASDLEVDLARIAHKQAKVRIEGAREEQALAQAELALQEKRLEQYRIEAPFGGYITRVAAEQGASLTRQDPILELVSLDPLEAQVYLPDFLYGRLVPGRTYPLQAGVPVNRTLSGRLKVTDPLIDPASRTFRAVFVIENDNGELPAGFPVRLSESALARSQPPE